MTILPKTCDPSKLLQKASSLSGTAVALTGGNCGYQLNEVHMRRQRSVRFVVGAVVAMMVCVLTRALPSAEAPLAIDSARVSIAGTSNIHTYTASTTHVRLTRAQIGVLNGSDLWDSVLKPGAIEAFEVAIPAATLTSPKEGLDKNMHKALKTEEYADITFRLVRLDTSNKADGCARAIGVLRIAGVEKEVAIEITTKRTGSRLSIQGTLDMLMTDYGIKPPTAMLGMLKTDPKVTVSFETVLAVPLT
jgi:polyisoprenoid-binding protein YceI